MRIPVIPASTLETTKTQNSGIVLVDVVAGGCEKRPYCLLWELV